MLEIEDVQQEVHTYTTKATILFSLYNHTGSVILHILLCSTSIDVVVLYNSNILVRHRRFRL